MTTNGYPKNFFQTNQMVMKFSGVWHPEKEYFIIFRWIYYLYCIGLHSFGVFFYVCEILQFSETLKSPRKLVAHVGMLGTHFMGTFKIGVLVLRRKEIEEVMKKLHNEKYYYGVFGKYHPGKVMLQQKRESSLVAILVSLLYLLT